MASFNNNHHSHHHHHHENDASEFKRKGLNAIQRRKIIKKVTFLSMVITAILMFIAVIWVYTAE